MYGQDTQGGVDMNGLAMSGEIALAINTTSAMEVYSIQADPEI